MSRLLPKKTVLLVESDPDVRALVVEILETGGFRVVPAATPETVLRFAEEGLSGIDLFLADTGSVGSDFAGVYRAISELNPSARLLFMSAGVDEQFVQMLGDQVERLFIIKPFSGPTLLARINDLLR